MLTDSQRRATNRPASQLNGAAELSNSRSTRAVFIFSSQGFFGTIVLLGLRPFEISE